MSSPSRACLFLSSCCWILAFTLSCSGVDETDDPGADVGLSSSSDSPLGGEGGGGLETGTPANGSEQGGGGAGSEALPAAGGPGDGALGSAVSGRGGGGALGGAVGGRGGGDGELGSAAGGAAGSVGGSPALPSGGAETGGAPDGSEGGAESNDGAMGGCDRGTSGTSFAADCPTTPPACTAGTWVAAGAETGAPLRAESEHFAVYYPEGTNLSQSDAQLALETLEAIWSEYFGPPMLFREPYCDQSTKYKASVHFDNEFPLWGGAWGDGYMGMWIGPAAARDRWGLAHEFAHGVQSVSGGLNCGGRPENNTCGWIYESHANYMPHQLSWFAEDVHCSEMLANAPHLYLGSTRNRYCNWQFMEYLQNTQCHQAVNDIWTRRPESSDPFIAIRDGRGWSQSELNDFIGDWAMHNVTWDYQESGAAFRRAYGPITDTSRPERRNRITRLIPLGDDFADTRRFQSPYYAAPQRFGYNVVRLVPQAGASDVTVKLRGVVQAEASSDWRWGLVATNAQLAQPRYSALQRGADGELKFCIQDDELLWLVVAATPSEHQSIYWDQPYASIPRYPYMIEVHGAWPEGYRNGAKEACPSGTVSHANGGGCAPASLPESVYVGPHALVLGGQLSGNARIEDQATILDGAMVSGGTVGGLTVLSRFTVSDEATVRATFYPPGYFESGQGLSGSATLLGDVEYRGAGLNRSTGSYSGFVDAQSASLPLDEVTVAPPYAWRQ